MNLCLHWLCPAHAHCCRVHGRGGVVVVTLLSQVAELKASYEASMAKRSDLENQQKKTTARLERAHKLTGGLGECMRFTRVLRVPCCTASLCCDRHPRRTAAEG